jgi:hypothetical protein
VECLLVALAAFDARDLGLLQKGRAKDVEGYPEQALWLFVFSTTTRWPCVTEGGRGSLGEVVGMLSGSEGPGDLTGFQRGVSTWGFNGRPA